MQKTRQLTESKLAPQAMYLGYTSLQEQSWKSIMPHADHATSAAQTGLLILLSYLIVLHGGRIGASMIQSCGKDQFGTGLLELKRTGSF